MRLQSYLQSSVEILAQYSGDIPFAAWLKNHFRQHKKFGSKDRRLIADLCFCYFRLGNAFAWQEREDRMLAAQLLCHRNSAFVRECKPEWQAVSDQSLQEKLQFLGASIDDTIFPFPDELSPAIDQEAFRLSFLQQPDLFLRIRPGKEKAVHQKLQTAGIAFSGDGSCLRMANTTKVDEIIRLDEEAVVQDISSQQVLQPLQQQVPSLPSPATAWDCCAASGGKTILLHDTFPRLRITASDIRESILFNLRNRLKRAGVAADRTFVADVSSPRFSLRQKFDIILCDAPCSGSGTWGRTPEQLSFFPNEKIDTYADLQKRIALNASKYLQPKGYFLYITCSVFRKENESVVAYLQQHAGLQVLSQQYFTGYEKKGDTLFAALFTTS